MIHDLAQPLDCHPHECDCPDCDAAREATGLAHDASRVALLTLGGWAVGMLIAGILDHVIAGPGLTSMIGG